MTVSDLQLTPLKFMTLRETQQYDKQKGHSIHELWSLSPRVQRITHAHYVGSGP